MEEIIERKIKKWIREKKRFEVITGCLPKDVPDVVKVKHRLMEEFIEDLEEIINAVANKPPKKQK